MKRFAFLLLVATWVGCSSSEGLVPCNGTVCFTDGEPVQGESATIIFVPMEASESAQSASSEIQSDGSFQLMTKEPGDGVRPGEYRVVLKVWSNYRDQVLSVAEKYTNAETTPLKWTVVPDEACELVVDRK